MFLSQFRNSGILLTLCSSMLILIPGTNCKDQYEEPLSTGMKMSVRYDIANIFVRPIASVVSVVLSVGLAVILFFGVITAPFGYFFGIPSRYFVLGGNSTRNSRQFDKSIFPNFGLFDEPQMPANYYEYGSNIFHFVPSELRSNFQCQQMMLCYSHSALHHLPKSILRFYQLYSQQNIAIDKESREAILLGISSRDNCSSTFDGCPDSLFGAVVKSVRNILPDYIKNRNFNRRKASMYM